MEQNNKITLIFVGLMLLVIGFSLGLLTKKNNEEKTPDLSEAIQDNEPKLYKEINSKKIFIKCIDSINLKVDNQNISLKQYLENNDIDSLIRLLTPYTSLNDGGTMIYKDTETKISNNGITLIKCNRLSSNLDEPNNKDIYIGSNSLQFDEKYCQNEKEDNTGKTFLATYQVLHTDLSNEAEYIWITLRKYNAEEITSVRVPTSFIKKFEVGKNYEFTFKIIDNSVNLEDTKNIFDTFELLKIEKTDKQALEQTNEIIQ